MVVATGFKYIGTNLSGGEFGTNIPGTLFTDYTYPTNQELDYYAAKGLNIIRLPFLIERVINSSSNITFRSTTDITSIDALIAHAATKGLTILLDPHNFGNFFGTLIATPTTYSQFATFWGLMAARYKTNSNVWFGLMNEPNQQTPSQWFGAINPAIAAIRATGATNVITVPGTAYTGAWTWISSGNAAAINPSTIVDSANNYVIEVHQYLDSDGSGSSCALGTGATTGPSRLTAITQWAQAQNPSPGLFLGELGVCTDAASLAALQATMQYMQQNSNVWVGYTYWSGGPWWGAYMYTLEPTNLGQANQADQPQMGVLTQFVQAPPQAVGTITVTTPGVSPVTVQFNVTQTGGQHTLTVGANASSGGQIVFNTPVLAGVVFTPVAGIPSGQAQWTFTF
jgi:endoglucanase